MSGVITAEAALQLIPGWDDASVSQLHGGLSNKTYKVTAGGRSGVLKIDNTLRSAPLNSRSTEARIQNTAADAGLAARVLYADERTYFTEYLEGDVWNLGSFDAAENLENLAAAIKCMHALPLTGRTFDAVSAAQRYAETSCTLDRALTEQCTATIAATPRAQKLCCCHNDLVAENLLSTPGLKFLDWEYACDNDPFFDLATVVEHHDLSGEQTATLLNAYSSGDSKGWLGQLNEQRKLYRALLWLWMAARPDRDAHEMERVAARLTKSRRD